MRNVCILFVFIFFWTSCQKDTLQEDVSSDDVFKKEWQTQESILHFIEQEVPDVFSTAEMLRIRTMLEQTPTTGSLLKRSGEVVELPAGSVDALQDAVDMAGPGGTVLVKAGEHRLNALVVIGHRINLIGEPGATMLIDNPVATEPPATINKGIRIAADRTIVKGIEFRAAGDFAGLALMVFHADRVMIAENEFHNFQYAIDVNYGDFVSVRNNTIVSGVPTGLGVTIINGKSASIIGNQISQAQFGIWACDKGGLSWGNTTTACFYGQIICKVPLGALVDDDGNLIGAESSGNHWLVARNSSSDNLYAGYVVIDGAEKNVLLANDAANNAVYDIELVGPTERFGFFTPTSVKNRVYSYNYLTIKDCGEDNRVNGGIQIDTSVDPCDM